MAKIATTNRRDLNPEQSDGNDLYKIHERVRDYVERAGLGDDYVYLFTIPVENGQSMDWYAMDDAPASPVKSLAPQERSAALKKFVDMHKNLTAYAQKLRDSGTRSYRNVADIIEKAMHLPGYDYIYVANGKLALVNWGFSQGDNSFVDDTQKLLKEIKDKINDAESEIERISKDLPDNTAGEKQEETSPVENSEGIAEKQEEPAQEPSPPEAPPSEGQEQEPAPDPQSDGPASDVEASGAPDTPTAQPSPPAPSASQPPQAQPSGAHWLPAALTGAGLILAGAAAAWYFLVHKPDTGINAQDSAIQLARGSVSIRDALINDNNEAVDISLEYENGSGKCLAREQTQTCEGDVKVTAVDDTMITLAIGELSCPNKDNYSPITLVCNKKTNMCEARGKDGAKWSLEVNMSGATR